MTEIKTQVSADEALAVYILLCFQEVSEMPKENRLSHIKNQLSLLPEQYQIAALGFPVALLDTKMSNLDKATSLMYPILAQVEAILESGTVSDAGRDRLNAVMAKVNAVRLTEQNQEETA